MARRDLTPGAKPFEVKGGLGFQSFGGMYYLGDPSMNPPNRPRKLINIRLGEKDIRSRPGLDATWDSGSGEAVVGMIEKLKASTGTPKIFWGPDIVSPDVVPNTAGVTWLWTNDGAHLYTDAYYYAALPVDGFSGELADDGFWYWSVANPDVPVRLYVPFKAKHEWALMTDAERCQLESVPKGALAIVGHVPYFGDNIYDFPIGSGTVATIWSQRYVFGASYEALYRMQPLGEAFTHAHGLEVAGTLLGTDFSGIFYGEDQWGPCLDPVVYFDGKWLATGSIVPVVWNPGAIPNVLPPSGNAGQQVFEVNFDAGQATPPANLSYLVANPDLPAHCEYHPKVLGHFYAGSLTEVFRMPGQIYSRIPTRAAGGMDGKTIRSMCVRTVRSDNPLTADEATKDKLYLGTHGGYPLQMASTRLRAGVEYELIPPFHDPTNGDVYSFDGTTVKLETGSLGPGVTVITLPDGSILACGYRAAKLLDAADNTWKAVAYNPVPSVLPRYFNGDAAFPRAVAVPAFVDAGWKRSGFVWTDRVIFDGTAYFIGYDEARLGVSEGRLTVGGGPSYLRSLRPPTAPANDYYCGSEWSGSPGGVATSGGSTGTADAWVLYKFNKATMEMVKVRSGDQIYADLRPTYFTVGPATAFEQIRGVGFGVGLTVNGSSGSEVEVNAANCAPPCLAVFDGQLLYSWGLIVAVPPSFGGQLWYTPKCPHGVGMFNGTTFDDDAVYYNDGTVFVPGLAWRHAFDCRPMDMVSTSRGVYIAIRSTGPYFAPWPDPIVPSMILWSGTGTTNIWQYSKGYYHVRLPDIGSCNGGRMFIGPG